METVNISCQKLEGNIEYGPSILLSTKTNKYILIVSQCYVLHRFHNQQATIMVILYSSSKTADRKQS